MRRKDRSECPVNKGDKTPPEFWRNPWDMWKQVWGLEVERWF